MSPSRFPFRDPRTVARDIPGVLDIIFPRLSVGLTSALNKSIFTFADIKPIPEQLISATRLQKSMLFEVAVAFAERQISGHDLIDWDEVLQVAISRQKNHFDVKIPDHLEDGDIILAEWAGQTLFHMIDSVRIQNPDYALVISPFIPGLGWIGSGRGDFSLGPILVEVKHTDRNFSSGDFRQIMMYWVLKYAALIEKNKVMRSSCILLNPRRNIALLIDFDYLIRSASDGLSRIEVYEHIRSLIGDDGRQ